MTRRGTPRVGLRQAMSKPAEKNIANLRRIIRDLMVSVARTHRTCGKQRGCGCPIDKVLNIMETSERDLFAIELALYSAPKPVDETGSAEEQG